MNEDFTTMELFAGAGGGILASRILGHTPLIAIEWEPYACQVLRERVADGWFPGMQVWEGDIRMFNPSEYAGRIFCLNAGFPCQDISFAGKQAGIGEGTRSNLYREVIRIADAIRPEYLFLENVAAIVSKSKGYLEVICEDLSEIGYDAVWTTLSAAEVGAKHKRDRWWCLAHRNGITSTKRRDAISDEETGGCRKDKQTGGGTDGTGKSYTSANEAMGDTEHNGQPATEVTASIKQGNDSHATGQKQACESSRPSEQYGYVADTYKPPSERNQCAERGDQESTEHEQHGRRQAEPGVLRMADDVAGELYPNAWNEVEAQVGRVTGERANRASRLKCIGNGQVPLQAAVAFSYLMKEGG